MEHNGQGVTTCWHCGAPVHPVQRLCLTCGATAEYRPSEFSPIALEEILGKGYTPLATHPSTNEPQALEPTAVLVAAG